MSEREEKMKSHLRTLAADFIHKIVKTKGLITVTSVSVSSDFRRAAIYLTVYPTEFEEDALKEVRRHATEFRIYAGKYITSKNTPYFEFRIDEGERNRQRIEELTKDIRSDE